MNNDRPILNSPNPDLDQLLCSRCASIDFANVNPRKYKKSVLLLGNRTQILLDSTCPLCKIFNKIVEFSESQASPEICLDIISSDKLYYLLAFHTSKIYADRFIYSKALPGLSETVSFTIIDESTFLSTTKHAHQRSILKSGWISPAGRSTPGPSFCPRITQSVTDFCIVKSWLDFCITKNNKTCHSLIRRSLTQFRVIDCDVRKVIPAELDIQYFALSYVWGQSIVTEHETNEFISFLPLVLPNVIEDAIQVVKRLGYRYLWVDKYYIRQGDSTDKQIQIQQMDLIYSNSQLTLIDAGSNDSVVGLHGVQLGLRAPSTSVKISGTSYVCVPPAPEPHILRSK